MKRVMVLLFFILPFATYAQPQADGFKNHFFQDGYMSPDSLSRQLTATCSTQLQKVRAIFNWIISNISYNTMRYQPQPVVYHNDGAEAADDADTVTDLNERVARIVLRRKYTLCDGYARLFKALCSHAGIESEVITGFARTNMGSRQFRCNHKWNAVKIDSNWYLLDATWASGYLDYTDNYVEAANDYYFLTPPKDFIRDHYPEDVRWTLLANPPATDEFKASPFKTSRFLHYKINSFLPAKGIINANVGDSIKIEINAEENKKTLALSEDILVDVAGVANSDSAAVIDKSATASGKKISMQFVPQSVAESWLQVIYNGDVILRYKLNISKAPFPYAPIIIKDIPLN